MIIPCQAEKKNKLEGNLVGNIAKSCGLYILTCDFWPLGAFHVPDGSRHNHRLAFSEIHDLDDPVLHGRVQVLLEEGLNLGAVGLILDAFRSGESQPETIFLDRVLDKLGDGWDIVLGCDACFAHVWNVIIWEMPGFLSMLGCEAGVYLCLP